jgi:hypothetical protein
MKDNKDETVFAEMMFILSKAFQKSIDAETIDAYFQFLKDLPFPLIAKAVREIIQTSEYFPTIKRIREKALLWDEDSMEAEALGAWSKASDILSHVLMEDKKPDERLDAAVRMAFGDWVEFSKTDQRNEVYDRAHFIKCYRAILKVEREKKLLGPGVDMKKLKPKYS